MDKNLVFKKYDGTVIEDVNSYVREWVTKYPHSEISIGCDSQQHTTYVKYSIAIVMHKFLESKEENPDRVGKGAHIISATIIDKNKTLKTDLYTKLFAEAIYTVEAAQLLDGCDKKVVIHLDYNSKKEEYSNILYTAGLGYVRGMGFDVLGKPDAWSASHAADALCKRKGPNPKLI